MYTYYDPLEYNNIMLLGIHFAYLNYELKLYKRIYKYNLLL